MATKVLKIFVTRKQILEKYSLLTFFIHNMVFVKHHLSQNHTNNQGKNDS